MHRTSRRRFIQLGAASAGLAMVGAPTSFAQSVPTIKSMHYGGPWAVLEKVGQQFAEGGLARMAYEVENSGTALAKMQVQKDNPPFNVALLTRVVAIRAMNTGLIEPLKPGDISDAGALASGALVPGGIGVALTFDSIDLMYDSRRVTNPIESWLDLWRPEFKGKILMPALPLPLGHLIVVTIAKALGGSERDSKAIDEAFKKLRELKPSIRAFYRDPIQANQLIERGEALVCPQYNNRIGNAMKASPTISRATPKEGIPVSAYDLVVVKGSPHQDIARKYVNFCLSASVQQQIANAILTVPVNKSAKIDPANAKYVMHDYSRLWFVDEVFVATKQRELFDRWTREIES